MSQTENDAPLHEPGSDPSGSARRVYVGILHDLERGRIVPGQRLVETELAARFAVGRNAVREAMQHLAVRGVIDLSPNRSPAIRRLDIAETREVLDVAAAMTVLTARTAALRFKPEHRALLEKAVEELSRAAADGEPGMFNSARRNYYRVLLLIGGNRELQRLFPAISMHVVRAQYSTPRLQGIRLADYRAIAQVIMTGDADAAEAVTRSHIDNVRDVIEELARDHDD